MSQPPETDWLNAGAEQTWLFSPNLLYPYSPATPVKIPSPSPLALMITPFDTSYTFDWNSSAPYISPVTRKTSAETREYTFPGVQLPDLKFKTPATFLDKLRSVLPSSSSRAALASGSPNVSPHNLGTPNQNITSSPFSSPLTPILEDQPTNPSRTKRRVYAASPSPSSRTKRPRLSPKPGSNIPQDDLPLLRTSGHLIRIAFKSSIRTFPLDIPLYFHFSLFYRRFPASSHFPFPKSSTPTHPGGTYNAPHSLFDLYTPRFIKGIGSTKMGLCPICMESIERGGEGKCVWLSMKFSAFKCYHMQYFHGISASTTLPFSPPTAFRVHSRAKFNAKHEKSNIIHGKCHRCAMWIPIEGIKNVKVKVKELFWWKHAAACHRGSTIPGETDCHLDDEVYARIKYLS